MRMMAELRKMTPQPAIIREKVPSATSVASVQAKATAAASNIGMDNNPNHNIGRAVNEATVLMTIRSNSTL